MVCACACACEPFAQGMCACGANVMTLECVSVRGGFSQGYVLRVVRFVWRLRCDARALGVVSCTFHRIPRTRTLGCL